MKKTAVLFFIFLPIFSFANYFVGGDIKFNCLGLNQYQFTITECSIGQPQVSDSVFFDFGDGSGMNYLGLPVTSTQISSSGYYTSVWSPTHTYAGPSGPSGYSLSAYFLLRIGMYNAPNAIGFSARISGNVLVDPFIGNNSSPYFSDSNLVNHITIGQNFSNNPGPIDPDGDSLSFSFSCSSDWSGCIAGYTFPDFLGFGNLAIDSITGNYFWNAPQVYGEFNVVIRTDEWKRFPNGNAMNVGFVEREIQFNPQLINGIAEQKQNSFSCFPNPVSIGGKINLKIPIAGNYDLKIYNSIGEIVYNEKSWMELQHDIILPKLSAGHFNIILTNENGSRSISDFILIPQ